MYTYTIKGILLPCAVLNTVKILINAIDVRAYLLLKHLKCMTQFGIRKHLKFRGIALLSKNIPLQFIFKVNKCVLTFHLQLFCGFKNDRMATGTEICRKSDVRKKPFVNYS